MSETVGQRRFVGVVWFIAAVVGLILAALVQPIADWGLFPWVLGVLVLLLGLVGLWMAITGKGHILNATTTIPTQRIIAVGGMIVATVLALSYLVFDWENWTALDVLTIAVWVSLGAAFLVSFLVTSRAMKG